MTSRKAIPRNLSARRLARAIVWVVLSLLALLLAGQPQDASAQAVRTNPGFTTGNLPRNDDGSSSTAIPIGFTVNFFGITDNSAFVNNNGNITFGAPLGTFTPEGLRASPLRIIAPFWADVDTRAPGSSLVTFGQDIVNGRPAFGVNYVNVGYYGTHDDKLNSFQLVLIDRSDLGPGNFDIEFNYDRIEWETGDASGGRGGLGGTSASAGYSNGSGKAEASFEILGSRRNGVFLDSSRNGLRYRTLNSNVRGRLIFFVREGAVGCTYAALSIDEIFPWQGGTGSAQVAAPGDCEWTAVSNVAFVTITSTSSGTGSADIEYTVSPNRSSRARTGTLTVGGQTIIVTQEAFVTLRVTPSTLNVSSAEGAFPSRVALRVESIRGPVSWAASVALQNGEGWRMAVTPTSGTATDTDPSTLILELNSGFFPPLPLVVYEAIITVRDTIEGPSVTVPVILSVSPPEGRLVLSQTAFVFRTTEGGAAPAAQTLRLLNSGPGTLNWSIASGAVSRAPWLNLSSTAGAAASGSPSSTELTVNPGPLAAGVYQVLVPVSAPGGTNDPQLLSVTLHVAPRGTTPTAETSPNGMVFLAQQGGTAPAAQNLTVSSLGVGEVTFQLGPSTDSGGNWLGVSAASGSTAFGPATAQVTANPQGLPAGVYRGSITATFSSGGNQEVRVVFVVTPPGGRTVLGTSVCAPQGMELAATTIGNGASLPVSFPRPLLAQIVNTCGDPVNHATVLVKAEGTTLVLESLGKGLYGGIWTPERVAPSIAVNFTALHPSYGSLQRSFSVLTTDPPGGVILPVIVSDGVVESAGFTPKMPLAPGSMISVFGSQLATAEGFATRVPLERQLAGASVRIGNEDVPLFYVGPGQINAQLPFTARPGESVAIAVNAGGKWTAPQSYLIAPVQPSIFHSDGIAYALDGQSRPITLQNPARIGDTLQIYATGLGLVEPGAETGAAAPASSTVRDRVRVTIGGVEAPVVYQGLAPGFVGLYQVNVFLPPTVTPGDEVAVLIKQSGIASNPDLVVTMPVRRP